jgi:hypothetical protein
MRTLKTNMSLYYIMERYLQYFTFWIITYSIIYSLCGKKLPDPKCGLLLIFGAAIIMCFMTPDSVLDKHGHHVVFTLIMTKIIFVCAYRHGKITIPGFYTTAVLFGAYLLYLQSVGKSFHQVYGDVMSGRAKVTIF